MVKNKYDCGGTSFFQTWSWPMQLSRQNPKVKTRDEDISWSGNVRMSTSNIHVYTKVTLLQSRQFGRVVERSVAMCTSGDECKKLDNWISPVFTLCDEALQKLRMNGATIFRPVDDPDNLWREREVFINVADGDMARKIVRMCEIYKDKVLGTGKAWIIRDMVR